MATFTVNTTSDITNPSDGLLTLREVIQLANASAGEDVIVFANGAGQAFENAARIDLQEGRLEISSDISIFGDTNQDGGADVTIDARGPFGVLGISAGIVLIDGLVITGGDGGISIGEAAHATITRTVITENEANSGGGIRNDGTLILSDSVVSNNLSFVGGAGIFNTGDATIVRTTIVANSGRGGSAFNGAGIWNLDDGILEVKESTIAFNSATRGGGINNFGIATIENTTIYGNTAELEGGGIHNWNDLDLLNVTITANSALQSGGGLGTYETSLCCYTPDATAHNSLIIGNTAPVDANVAGPLAGDNNILEGDPSQIFWRVDPGTGAAILAGFGGPTATVALNPSATNPALDAGSDAAAPETDARGLDRTADMPGIANNGANTVDIGAFEIQGDTELTGAVANTFGGLNMLSSEFLDFSGPAGAFITPTQWFLQFLDGKTVLMTGFGITTVDGLNPTGGTVTKIEYTLPGSVVATVEGLNHPILTIRDFALANNGIGLMQYLFAGNDIFSGSVSDEVLTGHDGADKMWGQGGNDFLFGGSGDDELFGGSGDDTLIGGAGADSLVGGSGIDMALYSQSAAAVRVNLQEGTGAGGDAEGDVLGEIDYLVGSSLADELVASHTGTTISGGLGNDTIEGGHGKDVLNGAEGIDTVTFANAPVVGGFFGVIADLGQNVTFLLNGEVDDIVANFENAIGSAFADQIIGNALANTIHGGDGRDNIRGEAGNDVLLGGEGFDVVAGGTGADFLSGGDEFADLVSYARIEQSLIFDLRTPFRNPDGSVNAANQSSAPILEDFIADDFEGFAGANDFQNIFLANGFAKRLFLLGGQFDDTFVGGTNNDSFVAGRGNDVMYGTEGRDGLRGGNGDDDYFGGADGDFFFFEAFDSSAGNDIIHDFEAGLDEIRFVGAGVVSLADLQFSTVSAGGDASLDDILITYETGPLPSTITVLDATIQQVQDSIVF